MRSGAKGPLPPATTRRSLFTWTLVGFVRNRLRGRRCCLSAAAAGSRVLIICRRWSGRFAGSGVGFCRPLAPGALGLCRSSSFRFSRSRDRGRGFGGRLRSDFSGHRGSIGWSRVRDDAFIALAGEKLEEDGGGGKKKPEEALAEV